MQMPLSPTWPDVALRLLLTIVGSGIIGWNRGVRGHSAGLRTTVLVGLAAALAMVQCNILLELKGRTGDSFATMDLMRLPLGILTGVGFIGGGAILKRGELVIGLTTAATLWVVTVLGLCFGGGQIVLGCGGTVLAVLVLWALREVEERLPRDHRAVLSVSNSTTVRRVRYRVGPPRPRLQRAAACPALGRWGSGHQCAIRDRLAESRGA